MNLPIRQGRITEMSKVFDELRSMGLSMTHEGWMEGSERHMSASWTDTHTTVYGLPGGDIPFSDIHNQYLGSVQTPKYMTPDKMDFVSDREDMQVWSQVPLE